MLAATLSQGTARKEGNEIVWTFSEQFPADSVNDARAAIEKIAAEVFGEKISVKAVVPNEPTPSRRAEDKPPALSDDPVLKAFQKHLGANVIETKPESRRSK
jgi:hypothetical protein